MSGFAVALGEAAPQPSWAGVRARSQRHKMAEPPRVGAGPPAPGRAGVSGALTGRSDPSAKGTSRPARGPDLGCRGGLLECVVPSGPVSRRWLCTGFVLILTVAF